MSDVQHMLSVDQHFVLAPMILIICCGLESQRLNDDDYWNNHYDFLGATKINSSSTQEFNRRFGLNSCIEFYISKINKEKNEYPDCFEIFNP